MSKIIKETSTAILDYSKQQYLQSPGTSDQWTGIAHDFQELWGLPLCLGADDGKYVVTDSLEKSGSTYFT